MNDTFQIIFAEMREIPDPRVERSKVHSIEVILFIALCTLISGGQSFYEMEEFAEAREEWLRQHIGMVSVPSHDTFNRVFQALDHAHFADFLVRITRRLREEISGDIVAFDGKTHRRSGYKDGSALHMLNAWSVGNRLVPGQLAVEDKSNEITAMPQLMDMLDLKKCIITADALNCQKSIAAEAIEKKADYVLALKGNHPLAHAEIKAFMDAPGQGNKPGFETLEKGHGRVETRRYWQSTDIGWFSDREQWSGLKSVCMVEAIRENTSGVQTQRRYFISSLGKEKERKVAEAIRAHWQIENALHWRPDAVFQEDQSRARTRNAAKNPGTLRAIVLNLIKKMPGKGSLKGKRYKAALNPEYLLMALKA